MAEIELSETAKIGEIEDRIDVLESVAIGGNSAPYATWSALAAVTPTALRQRAEVIPADTGTHTDPQSSVTVPNQGVYGAVSVSSVLVWHRVYDYGAVTQSEVEGWVQPIADEAAASAVAAAASAAELEALGSPVSGASRTIAVGRRWTPVVGSDPGGALTLILQDQIKESGTLNLARIMGGTTGGTVKIRQFSRDVSTNTFTQVGSDYSVTTTAGALGSANPAMAVVAGNYIGIQYSAVGAVTFTGTATVDNPGWWQMSGDHTTLVNPTLFTALRLEARFDIAYSETLVDRVVNYEDTAGLEFGGSRHLLIAIDGNSLMQGVGGATPPATYLAAALPNAVVYNFGVAGQTTQQMTADAVVQIDAMLAGVLDRTPVLIAHEMYNDIAINNLTPTQAIDNMVTYGLARKAAGWIVGVAIIPDEPSPSGGFATYTRAQYNTELKNRFVSAKLALTPFADFLVDYDKADSYGARLYPELADRNNSTYYQSVDHLHWTSAGGVVAARCFRHSIRDGLRAL